MNTKLRHISYCIIASLLFVACRQESHPLTPEEDVEVMISMDAVSVDGMETSRAVITGNSGLQSVNLGIYGYKQITDGTKIQIFNNTELRYTNGSWDYSPKKYWDRTAHYYFIGYAPYMVTTNYAIDSNTLTISDIPYWQTINGQETDYLVANSDDTAVDYLATETKSVDLEFSHILSQFVVKIVKDAALNNVEYKLTKVEYINVPAESAKATYTYKPGDTSSYSDISIAAIVSKPNSDKGETVTIANSNGTPITLSHLVVPFTLSGDSKVQIKVTYTIEGTERNKTVETQIASLNAGKCNELTLTFKGSEIIPSLSVKDWQNVEITEDPKYNW